MQVVEMVWGGPAAGPGPNELLLMVLEGALLRWLEGT